jgi:hypothetical protein
MTAPEGLNVSRCAFCVVRQSSCANSASAQQIHVYPLTANR